MRAAISRRALLGGAGGALAGLAVGGAVAPAQAASTALLARTALEQQIIRIVRELTPAQQDAWLRMGHRIVAGMSPRLAGYKMHRELGATAREARDRIDAVLAGVAAEARAA